MVIGSQHGSIVNEELTRETYVVEEEDEEEEGDSQLEKDGARPCSPSLVGALYPDRPAPPAPPAPQ